MANTITTTTLIDGSRVLIVKIDIQGDATGEESNTIVVDASTFGPAFTRSSLMSINSSLSGFSAELSWDATTNVVLTSCPEGHNTSDFTHFGGINNNAGAGKTGDILITTSGLATGATDHGSIILHIKKKV